jgi:hypothetical protein
MGRTSRAQRDVNTGGSGAPRIAPRVRLCFEGVIRPPGPKSRGGNDRQSLTAPKADQEVSK